MSFSFSSLPFTLFIRKVKNKFKQIICLNNNNQNKLNAFYTYNAEYIKCSWKLTKKDSLDLDNKYIFCLGIRIYDITTLTPNHDYSTCIMKETEINKKAKECLIPLPITQGKILIELGYRDIKKQWITLVSNTLNLSQKINKDNFIDDSWFYLNPESMILPNSLHQKIYNLSKSNTSGGSEQIQAGGSERFQARGSSN